MKEVLTSHQRLVIFFLNKLFQKWIKYLKICKYWKSIKSVKNGLDSMGEELSGTMLRLFYVLINLISTIFRAFLKMHNVTGKAKKNNRQVSYVKFRDSNIWNEGGFKESSNIGHIFQKWIRYLKILKKCKNWPSK